jgi:Mg2+ and Co2+ transporter CorA
LIHYYVHRDGTTSQVDTIEPSWLAPDSGAIVWADVHGPTAEDAAVLRNVFKFHSLAVEDALQSLQFSTSCCTASTFNRSATPFRRRTSISL